MIAGLYKAYDGSGNCSKAAGKGKSRLRMLKVSYLFLQLICIRASKTAVDKALVHMLVKIHRGIKILKHICAGLVYRTHMGHGHRLI